MVVRMQRWQGTTIDLTGGPRRALDDLGFRAEPGHRLRALPHRPRTWHPAPRKTDLANTFAR